MGDRERGRDGAVAHHGERTLCGEALRHRRSAAWAAAADPSSRGTVLEPASDAGDECAPAELTDCGVEVAGSLELEPDRSGTLGDRGLEPIEDQDAVLSFCGVLAGGCLRVVANVDSCAERAHARDLPCGDIGRDEDVDRRLARAGGVCEPLPEVARRRTDPDLFRIELSGQQRRAATLEATDRIQRLDLDDDLAPQLGAELFVDELW